MTADVIPREQAFANARAVLDAARARLAADRAAGRLPRDVEERLAALERQHSPTAAYRAAA
ncbi:hypothetical protein OG946_20340 [Streptomyces sp. NBC_01808]|uniref:hypothetical protein n=1 Tax=Streptomyces sp. NBC_01808 TaxID=2975947 RepID=UPI002DDC35F6|nr:hypothetical protein [Streptomyces sp. NBC_01808]WSA39506.1 hypothetical protein OG946_20340 [Streptomyces sp. NBC_01808]